MTPIQVAIILLGQILSNYKLQGAAAEVIASVEAAIENLFKAHGMELTFENLEALRVPIPDFTMPVTKAKG